MRKIFRNEIFNPLRRNLCSLGKLDKYGGLHIDLTTRAIQGNGLSDKLLHLCRLRRSFPTAVWVYLSQDHFHLIPCLCEPSPHGPGLVFHHATGLSVTLFRWLAEDPCRVPEFATHQLGVAAVLVSPTLEHVVMVRERAGSSGFNGWKFPTGLAHLGEDISSAVLRELYEETGILAKFSGILALRQQHAFPGSFGRSDFLVACRLRLPSACEELPSVRPCKKELSDGMWMPMTKLRSAQVHSVIKDLKSEQMACSENIHITTFTSEILRLLSPSKPASNALELRQHRFESILGGQWYDLYLPR
ncbi:Nucleoside diphosphate-linked moiety X motif 6 [Clonorchis sinensis]|uniref:Nucleoside diphosphate-linked moiety X motif 6 n=1 Tax=Clonorchis sinensis TaxID=79923 RepID=A0A8T1MQ15_CLOSI|nr:Nucleoside diphosphate-linked moiety X motif 6 [Clonorchis sinensis]